MKPAYLKLHNSGELRRRLERALEMQSPCRLCPRRCGARRAGGEMGFCGEGTTTRVFRSAPHFGEEPPISGRSGSGTVFFSGCALRCSYCQNHAFSQDGAGSEITSERLASSMLGLKSLGCHNVNLVTPTHFLPQIISSLIAAAEMGFDLPVVYNTSGYESLETLFILDGIVDIYIADMRYGSAAAAERYSGAADYPELNRGVITEIWRQVGPLRVDETGVARRGLIVRHLILPEEIAGTGEVCRFLAERISPGVALSLMSQYTPCHRVIGDPAIGRRITRGEYDRAVSILEASGLETGWIQEWSEGGSDECFLGTSLAADVV